MEIEAIVDAYHNGACWCLTDQEWSPDPDIRTLEDVRKAILEYLKDEPDGYRAAGVWIAGEDEPKIVAVRKEVL